jgi:hypothetical protein
MSARVLAVFTAIAAGLTGHLQAQSTFTWTGGNGSWIQSSKWSGGVFPDYNIDVDIVRIDGGNAAASVVDFTGHSLPGTVGGGAFYSFQTDRLEISSGDQLHVNDGARLFLWSMPDEQPVPTQLVNAGTLSISRVPRPNYGVGFMAFYNTTVSGGGTIILGSGAHAGPEETQLHIGGYPSSPTLPFINTDNLIRGRGQILGPVENRSGGTISADVNTAGAKLLWSYSGFGQPDQYPNSFTSVAANQNRLEAKNGGTLELSLGRLLNVGGTIEALSGSTVTAGVFGHKEQVPNDSTAAAVRARNRQRGLYGGTLRNSGGTVKLADQNIFLNGGAPGGIQLQGNIDIEGATIHGHIVNSGTLTIAPGNAPHSFHILNIDGDADGDRHNETPLALDGGGVVRLTGPGSYIYAPLAPAPGVATGDISLQNLNNTIEGQGVIFAAVNLHNHPQGKISANVPGGELRLAGVTGPNAPPQAFTNEGLLEAKNGGILKLDTSRIFQGNTGIIQIDAVSRLSLAGMQIEGGTIRNVTANGEPNFAPAGPNTGVHLSATGLLDGRPNNNNQPQPVKLVGAFYIDDSAAVAGTIMPVAAGQARIVVPVNTSLSLVDGVSLTNAMEVQLAGGSIQMSDPAGADQLMIDGFSKIEGWGSTSAPVAIGATGQLRANVADQELHIDELVDNAGLISAVAGGALDVRKPILNSTSGVVRAGDDGVVMLRTGGGIRNGTLDRLTSAGNIIAFGGTLENVTLAGPSLSGNPALQVLAGLTLRDKLINNSTVNASATQVLVDGVVTLQGTGRLELDESTISAASGDPATDGLINQSEIRGSGSIDVPFANSATGLIAANTNDATLTLSHLGELQVQNSGQIAGADGGQLVVAGYLKQTRNGSDGGTLNVVGNAGRLRIDGTVEGGEIRHLSPGGQIFMNSGTLHDLRITSDQGDAAAVLFSSSTGIFVGTITNDAVIELIDASVTIAGSVSLGGAGTLRLKQSYVQGEFGSLTLGANQKLRGFGEVQTVFTNHGTVIADGFGIEGTELAFQHRPGGAGQYEVVNEGKLRFPEDETPPAGSYTITNGTLALGPLGATGMQITLNGNGIIALGGGNLVGLNGSNIVALGGGNVIALGGANLVGLNGSNIVALGGGNIVALGGGNLVGLNGSNIVANGGGNLVGLNGSNIVALGGGNLVGLNGSNIVALGGGNIVALGGGNRPRLSLGEMPAGAPAPALVIGAGTFKAAMVSIEEQGILSPGDTAGAAGTLTVVGDLQLLDGGELTADLAVSGFDQVQVQANSDEGTAGAATLHPGSRLQLAASSTFDPPQGSSFTILNAAGGVTGEFTHVGLPQLAGRKKMQVNYDKNSIVLTVNGTITTFAEWQQSRFTIDEQNDPAISGATADPDGDGLSNRLEYFFGTEPKAPGSRAGTHSSIVSENGQRFFRLTFPRAQGMIDASFTIERNTTLANASGWATVAHQIVSSTPGNGVELITVKVLQAIGTTPEFFRVRVQ